ncbi:MAG: EXLDI protein [Ktedonobacteraceae bacterium]
MPNRTIYVADADVPTFEKAQELAGDNLSATIAQALHRFVEAEEAKAEGFEEVTVKVGHITHTYKRFRGRLLAKGRTREQNETRRVVYEVYQTAKAKLALYVRNMPDWNNPKTWSYRTWSKHDWSRRDWPQWPNEDWSQHDWSQWPSEDSDYRLEVYDTLEELKNNVPLELYQAVAQSLNGDADRVEFLDI